MTTMTNLNKLGSLNALPLNIDLSARNDGSGVETTLRNNNAKWHSSCFKKCSNREVNRAENRAKKWKIVHLHPSGKKL